MLEGMASFSDGRKHPKDVVNCVVIYYIHFALRPNE